MTQPKILLALPDKEFYDQPELQPLYQRLESMGEVRHTWRDAEQDIPEHWEWADASISWWWPFMTEEVLDAAQNMKFMGRIDISQGDAKSVLERGTVISCSKGGWAPAVAEMALTLILTTLRKVSDFHAQMRSGDEPWVNLFPADIDPMERELSGLTVGIIGFGGVGRRLTELLAPFNGKCLIVDPFVSADVIAAQGAIKVEMDELIDQADVVVLSAASNDDTVHILGAKEIKAMRPNAILINVARAALVDTDALVARLKKNDLFAAVDVFDTEPLPHDSELRSLPNLYMTPHRAGGIIASAKRVLELLIDDLEAQLAGRPLSNELTKAMVTNLDG